MPSTVPSTMAPTDSGPMMDRRFSSRAHLAQAAAAMTLPDSMSTT